MVHVVCDSRICERNARQELSQRKGRVMREQAIDCSGRIVLECGCGERLVLLGRDDDWYSQEHLTLRCECGEQLTLANRLNETIWLTNLLL